MATPPASGWTRDRTKGSSRVPSISSIAGTPSLEASLRASEVNVPVVMTIPRSARPCIAPRKSLIWLGDTRILVSFALKQNFDRYEEIELQSSRAIDAAIPAPSRYFDRREARLAQDALRQSLKAGGRQGLDYREQSCLVVRGRVVFWRGDLCRLFRRLRSATAQILKYSHPFQKQITCLIRSQIRLAALLGQIPNAPLRSVDQTFLCQVIPCPLNLMAKPEVSGRHYFV